MFPSAPAALSVWQAEQVATNSVLPAANWAFVAGLVPIVGAGVNERWPNAAGTASAAMNARPTSPTTARATDPDSKHLHNLRSQLSRGATIRPALPTDNAS